MAMARGTGKDVELRMADLGFGEEDELLTEERYALSAVGSRGGRRTSAQRKERRSLSEKKTEGVKRCRNVIDIEAEVPTVCGIMTCDAMVRPFMKGTVSEALTIVATMCWGFRNPGASSCGSFVREDGPHEKDRHATASARRSRARYSALTSGSPPWATRA